MEQTWRWFGPDDPVSLDDIRQAGASGIVTALHDIPTGEVWPSNAIAARKAMIENATEGQAALRWSVVESVPVHDDIKVRQGNFRDHIEAYKQTLSNLGEQGLDCVCYNFMPLIDWTRTDLAYELPSGGRALRFDADRFAAFDMFILERPGAEDDYADAEIERARAVFADMDNDERDKLVANIIAGLPGNTTGGFGLAAFRDALARYSDVDEATLRDNLVAFLDDVVPVAEEAGVRLAIHPDDPPRRLLGMPRVVKTADDVRQLLGRVDSPANGLTLCVGTYGVRADNDLPAMAREFGARIHFAHLRGTQREANPLSFHEAEHLSSDIDMVAIIKELMAEEARRAEAGRPDRNIPIRPDHGHQILDDLSKQVYPGYSAIGRLKGLAEIRGVIAALDHQAS